MMKSPTPPAFGNASWTFDSNGDVVVDRPDRVDRLPIHMMANGPQYFAVADALLRGFSGRDAARMLGEYDGPLFPKQQGRMVWVRATDGRPSRARQDGAIQRGRDAARRLFCATHTPGAPTLDILSARLTPGAVSLTSSLDDLETVTTVSVPVGRACETWEVAVTNRSRRVRVIDVALVLPVFAGSRAYVEYHRDVVRLYNKVLTAPSGRILVKNGLEWIEGKTGRSEVTYAVSAAGTLGSRRTLAPQHIWTDREDFLGPENRWDRPAALFADRAPRAAGHGRELVAAFEFRRVTLKPGETLSLALAGGIGATPREAASIAALARPRTVERLRRELDAFWIDRIERLRVETADRDFDSAWNRWWLHQALIRHWFGNTGHPQFDYGTDFSGWREIWQDLLATAPLEPAKSREHAVYTLSGIRPDGTNATRFFTRSRRFGTDEVNGLWCDHPYWTRQTIDLIAREQGDPSLYLEDGIGYFRDAFRSRGDRKDPAWKPGTAGVSIDRRGRPLQGTVLEHLLVQNLGMYYDCGARGLLRQRRADWNDAVDQVHGGENVCFTLGLVRNLRALSETLGELTRRLGVRRVELFEAAARLVTPGENDGKPARRQEAAGRFLAEVDGDVNPRRRKIDTDGLRADLEEKADALLRLVRKAAYNKNYYYGYLHANGKPIETTGEADIFLMPQTWALLADGVTGPEVDRLIRTVFSKLWDAHGGLQLNAPAFTAFDPTIGRISGFAPGTKENNAVFNHANLYWIHALLERRRAEDAWRVFEGISVVHRPRALSAGPHLPEYWISSDNRHFAGRAEYPLLTGTGPWTRMVFPQHFFGVRGDFDGLLIDPCLPDSSQFRDSALHLTFRGGRFAIRFRVPKGVSAGRVVAAKIDGRKVAPDGGRLLVHGPFRGRHEVEIEVG